MAVDGRVTCEGKTCKRSRAPRDGDPWRRWLCPKCWVHVDTETVAGICRLREQLSKAVKRRNHGDALFIGKRLTVVWTKAVAQIAAALVPQPRPLEEPAHVDAGE